VSLHSWRCHGCNRSSGREERQEHFEFAISLEGLFLYRGPRGRMLADLNTAICVNAGEPYQTSHPLGSEDAGISLVVEPATLADLLGTYDRRYYESRGTGFPTVGVQCSPRSHLLLSVLRRRLAGRSAIEPIVLEETLLRLVESLWRDGASTRHRSGTTRCLDAEARRARVDRVKQVLAAEFRRPLLIHEVAGRVALSSQHLCRIFKLETGMTVHAYLNRLRLRAATAAMTAHCDLSGIAFDVGFSSHSHFTQAYRREFGVTPSSFRQLASDTGPDLRSLL
jgi:AraC family transcriptional regulator